MDKPDAHIPAKIEVLNDKCEVVTEEGDRGKEAGWTYGLRSAQHLDALERNRFAQAKGKPATDYAEEEGAIRIPVRFQPTDLIVPKEGRLRLTIAGSLVVNPGTEAIANLADEVNRNTKVLRENYDDPLLLPSRPSESFNRVEILHALRSASGASPEHFRGVRGARY